MSSLLHGLAFLTLITILFVGHAALWIRVYNGLHATGWPRYVVRVVSLLALGLMVAIGVLVVVHVFAVHVLADGPLLDGGRWMLPNGGWGFAAWVFTSIVAFGHLVTCWIWRRWVVPPDARLLSKVTEVLDIDSEQREQAMGGRISHLVAGLPGNQLLSVQVETKRLRVGNLPARLDGLRVAHLSDFHMTGQLTSTFYEAIVERVNRWDADLIAVTGDIVDKQLCVDWIPGTLGKLKSRFGTYFILGNHDRRIADVQRLRDVLTRCGLEDLGGRCVTRWVRGCPVLLAGNERPWFPGVPVVNRASEGPPFSLALSHSPDQLRWAREAGFDLMLAGHTHGGQVRFPLVGAVVCPSLFGVRYASGLFDTPPTLLHVSRGLSGCFPVRFRCPPEISLLELRRRSPRGGHDSESNASTP